MASWKSWNGIALASWAFALGCGADAETDTADQERLQQSLQTWSELHGSSERQYRYTSANASWVGYSWRTTLEVANGAVISRAYELFDPQGMAEKTWTEDLGSLGDHPEGAALLTIDEIYERCATEVLTKDSGQNWITLTFNENGVLRTCSYFPKACADDCATGFNIATLEFL